ncbi:asparagine synthase (glutamine-hydrolyzing) [Nocardia mexicana]|uniref:asparagine synthase (glutamine-hydrolyzing) n=1 Tax=Nocardia mexicana TaxID=279262 RepID=A0A370H6L7_9NOCA|nr:asparagine synthase (glutamine-hydrolyzing) [Nocardia mexicana]RDI49801.1 asparagine synthase (glutamine-hydrolysing) [Nocardia mexicana]
MCGITGWISFDRDLARERDTVEKMTATMAERGPDAGGVWIEGPAALGHRRLAVIDLVGGTQPMTVDTPNGAVALVYSGEVYNFTELRADLVARGHRFRSRSDTEVVLRGYLEWGEAVVERLIGMYAFALWDAREQRLVLIRDRLGIKPLYLWQTDDGVLFGSEPKAILANSLARRVVGLDGLRELFTMIADPRTAVWEGMRQVDPGTVVTVSRSGLRERRYWDLATAEHTDDQPTTIDTVRDLLQDSIARQLVADVPLCTLLSGGLDSSAVTALAAARLRDTGEQVRAFTVDFADQERNFVADEWRSTLDSPFAREVAGHVGARHSSVVIDSASLAAPEVRAAVVAARDLPYGFGDSDASLYLLSRAVREHSTVALSGESADEIFAGYRWFHEPALRDAGTFPWMAAMPDELTRRTGLLRPELVRALDLDAYVAERYSEAVAPVESLPGDGPLDTRIRQLSYLHLTRFLRAMLDRKDRMSMATGLEVRVPFCDHRLIEYVHNVPWSLRAFDGREKSLLRAATADLLPQSVVERKKVHYPLASDSAYLTALQQQSAQVLGDHSGHRVFDLIDTTAVTKLTDRPTDGLTLPERIDLEQFLDLVVWLDHYDPVVTTA